jgi:hypothetical protein
MEFKLNNFNLWYEQFCLLSTNRKEEKNNIISLNKESLFLTPQRMSTNQIKSRKEKKETKTSILAQFETFLF